MRKSLEKFNVVFGWVKKEGKEMEESVLTWFSLVGRGEREGRWRNSPSLWMHYLFFFSNWKEIGG